MNSLDDIAKHGLKSIDEIVNKAKITSLLELKRIGISSVDDLMTLGVTTTKDLPKLGIHTMKDLAELGIKSADDLAKLGIKNIDDFVEAGLGSLDDANRVFEGASGAEQQGSAKVKVGEWEYADKAYKGDRLYQDSPNIIREIINSGSTGTDPRGSNGLWWKPDGSFNGSNGFYELLLSPDGKTIWYFVYKSY